MRRSIHRKSFWCVGFLIVAGWVSLGVSFGWGQSGTGDVGKLVRELKDGDPAVRGAAGRALTDLREARYLPELIEAWKKSGTDQAVRKQLVVTLGNYRDARAVEALAEALGDPAETSYTAAAELLEMGAGGEAKVVESLVDADRQESANDALMRNPEISVRLLTPLLKEKTREGLRVAAIGTLTGTTTRNAVEDNYKSLGEVPELIYALGKDANPKVRVGVAGAIQEFAESNRWLDEKGYGAPGYEIEKGRVVLEALANDKEAEVRTAAMQALGAIGDAGAIVSLQKHANDPEGGVNDAVTRQLSALVATEAATAVSGGKVPSGKRGNGNTATASPEELIATIRRMNETDIPRLIRQLKNPDSLVRAAAADQLGKIDCREHDTRGRDDKKQDLSEVAPLIRTLRDPHALVRAAGAEALGAIGAPAAVGPIKELLRDAKPKVVLTALKALADMTGTTDNAAGEENAVQAAKQEEEVGEAVKPLLASKVSEIRSTAYDLLSRVATPGDGDTLLAAANDEDLKIRNLALEGLTRILIYDSEEKRAEEFDAAAGKLFAAKLNDATCREAAINGLTALKKVPQEAVEPLIAIALEQSNLKPGALFTGSNVEDLLVISGDPRVVAPLIDILQRSGGLQSGARAAEALGKIGDASGIASLLKAMQAPNQSVRFYATRAIAGFKDDRVVPAMMHALSDADAGVRSEAARSLGNFKEGPARASVLAALIHSLTDENGAVSAEVANSLAKIGDLSAVEPLERLAPNSWAAVQALGELKTPAAVDFLLATLADKTSKVREQAATALGNAGDKRAVPLLIEVMLGADPGKPPVSLAGKCAEALGKLKDPGAVKALRELVKKNSWGKMEAEMALMNMGASATE